MKSLRLLPVIVAAIFLFSPVRADPVTPTPAPGWVLNDVDGKPVNFSQFKGKVIVLDFWATWCGPCRSEIPGYVKLQEKYRDKGLVIIGVSLDQAGPEVVKKFIGDFHLDYQVVMGDDAVAQAFGGVDGIPTTFIIDRTGKIRDKKIGAMETAEYEKVLLQYLN
ncbi:MAG TPA: TlpA disulfide reductase family protein [Opitutaceae bacterium]|jgi:thiol-disulfide isomerase/thioredoxin|nr:TlpA disulfide reductase family protein [Opitutaceae bacterium]